MEDKLMMAASELPEPQMEFAAIRQRIEKREKPVRRWLPAVAALAVALCLGLTVYAVSTKNFGLWSGIHSSGYGDVVLLNWRYDYEFPETLGGMDFYSMSTYYGAPEGASHLQALLSPTYTMHNVDYTGYCEAMQEDGTLLRIGQRIDISFGTTENENWKYHFSVAEDGSCNYEGVQARSQRSEEYRGYTLYFYTSGAPSVRWEDEERNLVIDMTFYGFCREGERKILEIAKELIDLNASE